MNVVVVEEVGMVDVVVEEVGMVDVVVEEVGMDDVVFEDVWINEVVVDVVMVPNDGIIDEVNFVPIFKRKYSTRIDM